MFKVTLLILSLISTVTIHIIANALPINNHTAQDIVNRLPSLFTPASYVFFIWPAIYFLLTFWVWNILKENRPGPTVSIKQTTLFVCSSILNILWILFWHYELFVLSLVVVFALLGILFLLYKTYPFEETSWKKRFPISIYLGWIFISTIINLDYLITFYEFSGWGITKSLWTVIFLTVATAIALHFRYHYNDRSIVYVFIWAFIGIAVRHQLDELLITSASIFLCCVLIVGILFIKKMPRKD